MNFEYIVNVLQIKYDSLLLTHKSKYQNFAFPKSEFYSVFNEKKCLKFLFKGRKRSTKIKNSF